MSWIRTFLVLAVVVGAANYLPLLITYPEQDDCTFGPVSNERYRAYLAEAKLRHRTKWPAFDNTNIEGQLNFRLADMLGDDKSIFARIAIMHAILRSLGAEYLNATGQPGTNVFVSPAGRGAGALLNYQLDINRLVFFQLYPRQVWVQAILYSSTADSAILSQHGHQRFVAHVVNFLDPPATSLLNSYGSSCPPLPIGDEINRFEAF